MILKLFRVQRRRWTSTKLYYLNRCTLSNNLAEIVALAVWHHAAVPPAALLVGYVSIQICALFPPVRLAPPCRRPILNATPSPLYARRYTNNQPNSIKLIFTNEKSGR